MMPHILTHAEILTATAEQLINRLALVPCTGKRAVGEWGEHRWTLDEIRVAVNNGATGIAVDLYKSGIVDVECDSTDAEEHLRAVLNGNTPTTPTYRSSRGFHRLFRRPAGLPDTAALKIDEIEFRLGNQPALSVLPPSRHPGGALYAWEPGLSIDDVPLAELPSVLVEMIQEADARPATTDAPTGEGIPEGERNNTLFKIGTRLRAAVRDIAPVALEAALQAENRAKCIPPLTGEEVAGIARSCFARSVRPQTAAATLLEIAEEAKLWRSPDGAAYASIMRNEHREHWRLRSLTFRQWLSVKYYEMESTAPAAQAMTDALNVLEGKASAGEEHLVFVRVGEHGGKLYLDLADESWRVVEIDAHGWRIVSDPPVRFRRTKRILSLPAPERGGSVNLLRPFVNVCDEQWPLVLAWLVHALRPDVPYPVLKANGEQGSAKSTTARVLRSVIDPQTGPLQRPPRSERDLMISAANSWVPCFDNLSSISAEMSDALCVLSTGGSYSSRLLYSDDDEALIVAKRPVIINGIEDIGNRSDLVDRSIHLELPRIDEGYRRSERSIMAEFAEAHPKILGALLGAVSAAIRNLPSISVLDREWPRMIDFAQWGVAAEPALGLRPGKFMRAYDANRADAHQTALETSPVAVAVQQWSRIYVNSQGQVVQGGNIVTLTATELLAAISHGQNTSARQWPKTPKVLSGILARLAPNLRHVGIEVSQTRVGNRKLWKIAYGAVGTQSTHESSGNLTDPAQGGLAAPNTHGTHGTQNRGDNLSASPSNGQPARTHGTQSTQESDGHLNGQTDGRRTQIPTPSSAEDTH
jgi:hypothetical protein